MNDGDGAAFRLALLKRVYGDRLNSREIETVSARIEALISGSVPTEGPSLRVQRPKVKAAPTWLIAYPDQFSLLGTPPLETLRSVVTDHLSGVVDGVHVLPFHPWSTDGGFSVEDYDRVDERYGTWDQISALAANTPTMFDAVINHLSVEGPWFQGFLAGDPEYAGFFRTGDPSKDHRSVVRPRTHPLFTQFTFADGSTRHVWTTFSADQADLDYANPDVLVRVLQVLLAYTARGARAIRLDAVGFLWKDEATPSIHLPQTHDLIKLMRSTLDAAAPGTLLISETNVPHAENISYLAAETPGEPEVHAVYQFPLAPLVAHAALTGDTSTLRSWLTGLGHKGLAPASFLNFLASHDGIGLRPAEGLLNADQLQLLAEACVAVGGRVSMRSLPDGGEAPYELNTTWFDLMRFDVESGGLVDEVEALRRHLACHEIMLALPGIAAIYVHSLFGSPNDQRSYAETEHNRDLNRARFTNLNALWALTDDSGSRPAQVLEGLIGLVARRRAGSLDLDEALDRL